MEKMKLLFESKKCTGCRLCEQWCTISHFGVTNPVKSRIHIYRDHEKQLDHADYCHLCEDTPCISACSYEALSLDKKNGSIVVNNDKCTGCEQCIQECPYNAPTMHPTDSHILICDLCGGAPNCVKYCPEQAISYIIHSEVKL